MPARHENFNSHLRDLVSYKTASTNHANETPLVVTCYASRDYRRKWDKSFHHYTSDPTAMAGRMRHTTTQPCLRAMPEVREVQAPDSTKCAQNTPRHWCSDTGLKQGEPWHATSEILLRDY